MEIESYQYTKMSLVIEEDTDYLILKMQFQLKP